MRHLRPTAIAGLLLAAATLMSSCGFDYPTDRVNTVGAGVNDRDASVDALGIRILAFQQGEGRLIGSLANNTNERASLSRVTSTDGVQVVDFRPVRIAPSGAVNLAEGTPVAVTGDFTAGDFVTLELVFNTDESVSLDVPVVKPCFQYSDVATPSASESAAGAQPSASASAPETTSEAASETTSESAAAGESAGEESGDATYTCADEAHTPEAHGEGE